MKGKDHIMDILVLLFTGCLVSISGHIVENHSADVKNIFNNFDTLNKLTNTESTPIVCVKSVADLSEIENAFSRIDERISSSHNDVSIQFSSDCNQLGELKTKILKLVNELDILVTAPISTISYRHHKGNLESKILLLKNLLDSTKKSTTGEPLDLIVKLQNEFQSLQSQMLQLLSKFESEQKLLNDANVKVAIGHLEQGKLDEAVAAFVNVTDHDLQIERFIASVYGNGDNFDRIAHFIVRLPALSRLIGFRALYDQLKKNNQLLDHRIWVLACTINQMPEKDSLFIDAVMTEVKAIVRNNNFDGLTGSLNKNAAEGIEALKHFAPVFVQTIYEETDNGIEKLFAVSNKFTFIRHRLYLINELILMLKGTGRMHGKDMSMIVFELIKLRTVDRPQNKFWQKLIEQNLPDELRDLMYNNLCIQNAENDEYLYAGLPDNEKQRHVYTARAQPLNESFYWQVYFTDNGAKLLIKNNKFGEHLYLVDEGKRDDEHVLRSWIPNSLKGDATAEFSLDMLGDGQFLIVNNYFNQVLYSPFDGEPNAINNRPVFSKKYDANNIEIDSKWFIGICRVNVEYDF